MNQAEEITRHCVRMISVNLSFNNECHILDAVTEAMRAGRMEAATLVQKLYDAPLRDGSPGPITRAILEMK